MIISSLAAMAAGYVLGMLFGTPSVISADRYMRILCSRLEASVSRKYQDSEDGQHTAGTVYLITLLLITFLPVLLVLILLYCFVPALAIVLDALICWSVTDIKGLVKASSAVSRSVRSENYPRGSRYAEQLSRCDCSNFDMKNIVRASVQGIADRTVDNVTAPLLAMFLFSGAGAIFWKAVDCAATVPYKNNQHGDAFANPSRKLHSLLCYIPGKLAAVIMLVDALFLKLNTRAAERTMLRDSEKCRRICFGGCRAVLAGIMGISLLPEEVFNEQFLRTYTIGEHLKEPEAQDVTLACQLMLGTSFIIMMLCFVIKLTIGVWF